MRGARMFCKWIQTGSAGLTDCARRNCTRRLLPAHDLDASSASTRDRCHRRSRHPGGSPAHPRTATNWRCCRKKWPRLPAACSRCAAPAEPRASLLERCCRVSDSRREPFRSRRQACRSGRMESSDRWRTIPKLRSRRWRRSANFASVGVDVEPAEPLAPDLLDIVATARERKEMRDDPCHGRLLFSDQGGDLQGRLSPRPDVPGSPRRRGEPFGRRRHGCGPKWTDRQLPLLCCGPHCRAGVHSGARRDLTSPFS